jgi:hypothetical protein
MIFPTPDRPRPPMASFWRHSQSNITHDQPTHPLIPAMDVISGLRGLQLFLAQRPTHSPRHSPPRPISTLGSWDSAIPQATGVPSIPGFSPTSFDAPLPSQRPSRFLQTKTSGYGFTWPSLPFLSQTVWAAHPARSCPPSDRAASKSGQSQNFVHCTRCPMPQASMVPPPV